MINGQTSLDTNQEEDENLAVKLFVGGLSWQTGEENLRQYFCQFGALDNVQIMKDPFTMRSRGFGFITFTSPTSLDRVLSLPSHVLDGKKIDPKPATPKAKSKEAKSRKIFVGGVSQDTSAEEVKKYFGQYGSVEDAVMLMDQITKRHRGFGFVTFTSEEAVDLVCNLHYHNIKNKKVECKRAQPKEAVMSATTAALLGKRLVMIPPASAPLNLPLLHQPLQQTLQQPLQQPLMGLGQLELTGKMVGSGSAVPSVRYSPYQTVASSPSSYTSTYSQAIDLANIPAIDWSALGIQPLISLQ